VELARAAQEDLERLVRVLSLPADTRQRIKRSLRPLARFPRLGPELTGRWSGHRFVLGPWRWLVIVYVYEEAEDKVLVVTMQDARSATAATGSRVPGHGLRG
jgi:plasmid stabilization system protein ParE